MRALIAVLTILGSSSAFAAQTTVDLTDTEIQSVISIFDRTGVKGKPTHGAACFFSEAQISNVSYSMNPASWSVVQNGDSQPLLDVEIKEMIALFDRLPIKPTIEGGVRYSEVIKVRGGSCGMSPAHWSATFESK